jgi:hypothetical protein
LGVALIKYVRPMTATYGLNITPTVATIRSVVTFPTTTGGYDRSTRMLRSGHFVSRMY